MLQLQLPFNHEPSINRMVIIMATEDIENGNYDDWEIAYESNYDILKNRMAENEKGI